MFEILVNVISPIFLIVGAAAFISRRTQLDTRPISTAIIYLMAPCLVLHGVATSTLEAGDIGRIAIMVIGVALILAGIAWGICRLFQFERQLTSAFILSVMLVNAANYGLPVNVFAFGESAEAYAIVYYAVSVTVVTALGIFISSQGAASAGVALRNVLAVPLTYAGLLGLLLNLTDTAMPAPLERAVAILGQGAVPAMLVVLGANLANMNISGQWRPLALAVGLRLLVAPVVAVGLALLLGLDGLLRDVSIVQSSMPTAVMAGAIAQQFHSDAEFTTGVILVGTLTSILTLSVLLSLLT